MSSPIAIDWDCGSSVEGGGRDSEGLPGEEHTGVGLF